MTGEPALADGYVDAGGGDRIHYVEQGTGTPLLLVHGAFGSGALFLQTPFGQVLAQRHRVIAPDSLAHGKSAAPPDASHYGARRRAGHLAAVLDALKIDRAHVVGYSMGGWMASAFATFAPERLASLSIGGWDVVSGMYTPAKAWGLPQITYDFLAAAVRRDNPQVLAWLKPEDEPGLAAAVNGMNDLTGLAEGVARCQAPAALFVGESDLYYPPCAAFAAKYHLPLLALPGDHITMLDQHGGEAARMLCGFIEEAEVKAAALAVLGLSNHRLG